MSGCLLLLTDVYRSQFVSWAVGCFVLWPRTRVASERRKEIEHSECVCVCMCVREERRRKAGQGLLESVNDASNWAEHLLLNGPQSNEPSAREKK